MTQKKSPPLTLAEVRRLAALARVGATEEELERMLSQLTNILENFRVLQEVDTTNVEPTGHAIAVENVMRQDVSWASMPHEEVLANAPITQEGYVRVRVVLEE